MKVDQSFPKKNRLLERREFLERFPFCSHTPFFKVVWKPSVEEKIGITLKKKFLRESPGRNRIKRLVREAYRRDKERWKDKSIHILGKPGLGDVWKKLTLEDVKRVLETVVRKQGTSTES